MRRTSIGLGFWRCNHLANSLIHLYQHHSYCYAFGWYDRSHKSSVDFPQCKNSLIGQIEHDFDHLRTSSSLSRIPVRNAERNISVWPRSWSTWPFKGSLSCIKFSVLQKHCCGQASTFGATPNVRSDEKGWRGVLLMHRKNCSSHAGYESPQSSWFQVYNLYKSPENQNSKRRYNWVWPHWSSAIEIVKVTSC